MAEKKSTNRADAVELVDMALGDLKKVAGQLGICLLYTSDATDE